MCGMCLFSWIDKNSTCPYCRNPTTKLEHVVSGATMAVLPRRIDVTDNDESVAIEAQRQEHEHAAGMSPSHASVPVHVEEEHAAGTSSSHASVPVHL